MSPIRIFRSAQSGFTLLELMVVAAVIVILAAIALPAYNNYTLKSKFTEVILAAAPTKTAISACAATGDCVANGGSAGTGSSGTGSSGTTTTTGLTIPNMAPAGPNPSDTVPAPSLTIAVSQSQLWALIYASWRDGGYNVTQSKQNADAITAASLASNGTDPYYLISDGTANGICASNSYAIQYGNCTFVSTTAAHMAAAETSALDPYFGSVSSGGITYLVGAYPCVGSGGCSPGTKYVSSVSYDVMGVITATATSAGGLKNETAVLVPSYANGRVDWTLSGSCKTRAAGSLC